MEDLFALTDLVTNATLSSPTARKLAEAAKWGSASTISAEAALISLQSALERPARGHVLANLALAVAEGPANRDEKAWRSAAKAVLLTAAEVIAERPDEATIRRAQEIERKLILTTREPEDLGRVHAAIGSAQLTPFGMSPAFDDYEVQLNAWWPRTVLHQGVLPKATMPYARAALDVAVDSLTHAVTLLRDRERARSLADLAYARFTQACSGLGLARDQIVSDCLEAWPLLGDDPARRATVAFALSRMNALNLLGPYRLDFPRIDALIRSVGLRRAAMTAIVAVTFRSYIPDERRQFRMEMLKRLPSDRLEAERSQLEAAGAHILPLDPLDCEQAADGMPDQAQTRSWSGQRLSDAALHVFAHGGPSHAALRTTPKSRDRDRLLQLTTAFRIADIAAERYEAKAYVAATDGFAQASVMFGCLGYRERTLIGLKRTTEAISKGPPDAAAVAIRRLQDRADDILEWFAGTGGLGLLRMLYGQVFTGLSATSGPTELTEEEHLDAVVIAMQMAKGRALSCALDKAGPLVDDASAAHTLTLASGLLATLDPGTEISTSRRFADFNSDLGDNEAILSSHWHECEAINGDDTVGVIANLRQRYQHLDQVRCATRRAKTRPPYRAAELKAALTPDTVLAAFYYWGVGKPPRTGFHCLLCTSDSMSHMAVFDPRRPADAELFGLRFPPDADGQDTSIAFAEPGPQTAHLRRSIIEDPLHGVASRQALVALHDSRSHFEPVIEALESEHAAGRNRLVIWPHGPQYLLPFHLLPTAEGRIVADDWTVTLAPSLHTVMLKKPPWPPARTEVVAIASSLGGVPFGLPPEPSVENQARAVAAVFGTEPLSSKSRESLRANVQGTRYLHIAAHGAFYHSAPLFHQIYLDDGPLYAHEVLKLDLRSVDLVTVSACESALVRYDENDSLLGLPAAFLRAGASAVIGALWPIDPTTALDFFKALYDALADGASIVKAFRIAQLLTRERHPGYRDWGAFCMLGGVSP